MILSTSSHFRRLAVLAVFWCAPLALAKVTLTRPAQAATASLYDFADLVEKASPAVVNIRTTTRVRTTLPGENDDMADFFRRFFGVPLPSFPGQQTNPQRRNTPQQPEEEQNRGIGSGFIISADGYIMTNSHVVDGAESIYVTLSDKREFKAKLIGQDKRTDVALVKVEATGLNTLPLGDSDKIRVGERVLAIGSPFGLDNTVTAGIVSAKSRDTGEYLPFIQTDVAVNPGNSGGPLINMRGEAIGINSQIYSRSGGSMGISFAIPIDEAMRIVDQLKKTGRVSRGRIGVLIGDVSKEVAESLNLGKVRGALIRNVEPGSPADRAGIEAGDIVLRFNNREIEKSTDLPRIVGETRPNSTVPMGVWRKGSLRNFNISVIESEESKQARTTRSGSDNSADDKDEPPGVAVLGLGVADIPDTRKRELKLSNGVEVQSVEGAAARTGIQPGDLIMRIGDIDIVSAKQFDTVVRNLDKNRLIAIFVRRSDATQVFTIRPAPRER